jgi:dsRNA-specific ribonuclease
MSHDTETPQFRLFIISLLERLDLNEQSLASFTDEESMIEFSRAFTHKSWSPSFNYERYEFLGDTIVNDAVAHYISINFPRIQNVAWMTRIKHTLISKKYLASIAHKADFARFFRYGETLAPILKGSYEHANKTLNKEYLSILEDVFEAFIGALRDVVDKKTVGGVGGIIARRMVHTFLDKNTVPVTYEEIFDPKSRLKEIYDKYHWGFSVRNKGSHGTFTASMVVVRGLDGLFNVEVYGYPVGTREKIPKNRRFLCVTQASSKEVAQQNAARKALDVLQTEYYIQENRSSPN